MGPWGPFSPVQIAFLIIAGLALVGVVIAFIRSQMTFWGYAEIASEVLRLGPELGAEAFRDGPDVVLSGRYEGSLVVVRFSNAENTPGLNVRMQAAATFVLSVAPAGEAVTEGGRVQVATTDDWFDRRFTTRTNQPMQAKMLITRPVAALLQQLACSRNTYLTIGKGMIELSELGIPQPDTAKHVLDHLQSMAKLGEALRRMPGSDRVKLTPFKRERHIAARLAITVGAVVALLSVFAAVNAPKRANFNAVNQPLTFGNPAPGCGADSACPIMAYGHRGRPGSDRGELDAQPRAAAAGTDRGRPQRQGHGRRRDLPAGGTRGGAAGGAAGGQREPLRYQVPLHWAGRARAQGNHQFHTLGRRQTARRAWKGTACCWCARTTMCGQESCCS